MLTRAVVCAWVSLALASAPVGAWGQVTGNPVITSLSGPGEPVLAGGVATISAAAEDPAAGSLSYAWTATAGTIAGAGSDATWTAPTNAGTYTITVTVTNAYGSTASSLAVRVVLAGYRGGLAAPLTAPRRLCTDELGNVYAIDARDGALVLLTARGEIKGRTALGEPATAVASGPGTLYVATGTGKLLEVDPREGTLTRELPLAGGPLRGPAGIAYEPSRMLIWVAERAANRVRALRPDGTTAFVLTAARNAPLTNAVDVAVDGAKGKVWVVLEKAPGTATTASPELGRVAHSFTLDGVYVNSLVLGGTGTGRVARAGGIGVDGAGQLHVADVYQGEVLVFTSTGTLRGSLASYGTGPGGLRNPLGIAFLRNGDVVVANLAASRIERFGATADLPTCDGDLDCDGLPDSFETANGLNPASASDALTDPDGDGLSNPTELALGTNPLLRDTDGDGWGDREEILAGFDPLDPNDHRPRLSASGPDETRPGLVQLSSTAIASGAACTVEWTQRGGPAAIELRGAAGGSPSYVARTAGTYVVEAVATCGGVRSEPVAVQTRVLDVPPAADAGAIRVVSPRAPFALDARGSTDANGDALSFSWDQALGPVITGTIPGPWLPLQIDSTGFYVFAATARDPSGNEDVAEVPVLVVKGPASTAVVSTPVQGAVGSSLVLDATGSFVASSRSSFAWKQVLGPAVALDASAGAFARFTPVAPGRYGFEVWIVDGGTRSPPARVDAFVADETGRLPTASVASVGTADVGAPVVLDGGASAGVSGTPEFAWRQIAGPAAGLTEHDRAVATVVPFAPGSYEFELVVRDGEVEGIPARVRFDARLPGSALPVAVATAPGVTSVTKLVVLDGTGSTGGTVVPIASASVSGARALASQRTVVVVDTGLSYRWTQLAGPWVALDDATSPAPAFRPAGEGVYTFELVVESDGVRSAPAVVSVLVVK